MVSKPDMSTRRILTFPAIRHCEAVSTATLLDSLLLLASNIFEYKSKPLFTNYRNAQQSLRLVGVLSIFFEEIRENRSDFSDSSVLSFSELHFILQKLRFLLEDFTCDGARLWTLMKCEFVASLFRVLIRAIATALDVLPLRSIEVSLEARESVQLVMKQARELQFEVDPADRLVSNDVISILSQFGDGIVPDSSDLRRVLNQLGIKSWSECNREIKLLESEMGFEYLSEEKRDLGLLSSLIGLMSYCRVVLFEFIDTLPNQQPNDSSSEVIRHLNTDDFRCPISLELMTDPVTVQTGHTYDRSSILKWFKAGNPTCPKTGERLKSTDLVPNLALKQLISQYCCENGIPVAEKSRKKRNIVRTVVAGSVAAEEAMKMLSDFLVNRLENGTGEEREKASFEIRILTKASIFNRSCLAESGAIPRLLNLLPSTNPLAQENALAGLLNLSKHSKSKTIIVENGGVELILGVLKEGLRMEARQHAAGTLFYLASVEEYRVLIGEIPGAIQALMDLIRNGSDRCKKNALVAIFGLLMYSDNHWRVLSAGLVPLLVNLLTSLESEELIVDSLAVLATIAEKQDGTMAILRAKTLPVVVEILNSTTSRAGKDYCVSLLLALCLNGEGDVVPVLVKNPSLMAPLYALLTKGTSRSSKKASLLIRLLHEFHERSSSNLMSPAFPRERFVHVW
ncbi:U-box domain-containing protein [Actinidia chinensis var. chinensis]|uniref:RING-type E3 ubiquitin transferase n=1 Tax=Actinidia chinensis var. chinensis TaxID=1590841 RepID=A0A2R6RE67_ACTCC|nr:U-box domain-containing protein [Actinidia chinensis var. chinensis]